jgi:hypothetical protein
MLIPRTTACSTTFSLEKLVQVIKDSGSANETGFIVFVCHSYPSDEAIDSRSFLSRKLRVF